MPGSAAKDAFPRLADRVRMHYAAGRQAGTASAGHWERECQPWLCSELESPVAGTARTPPGKTKPQMSRVAVTA
jgi:hypothetical protein